MDVWGIQIYGKYVDIWGHMDVHAFQLHLKEYVRSFLIP